MTHRLTFSFAVLLVLLVSPLIVAQPADQQHAGKVVLFGALHAHSSLSDDAATLPGNRNVDFTPLALYTYARDHGLNFLGVSDHQKATDSNHRLFMTAAEYRDELFGVAMTFNADHPDFIAIPGIEWGNTSTGNHLNVFGSPTLPPDTILDKEYDELYTWARANAKFVTFNHPNSGGKKAVGNYGEKRYGSQSAFQLAADPIVETIDIITSVRGGHITGDLAKSENKTHRMMQWEQLYQKYLNMGFHVSPGANHDTHRKNAGTVTAARTAVWADTATYDDLMRGFRANRVYTTEDDELAVSFQVQHGGRTAWMGETVDLNAATANVTLKVKVWQVAGSDGDPTDEGPYTVEVVSDWQGKGGRLASVWETYTTNANGVLTQSIPVNAGEYFYLVITEQNGKDNAEGDGTDEFNNETGEEGADGKRDDMNDHAWTTPIWFKR